MSVQSYIDGVEVTDYVLEGSFTRRLNRPATATIRMPIQFTSGWTGSRLKIVVDGVLNFHGMILTISDDAGEDTAYTEYVAQDPMEIWKWRPVRDEDGDFTDPDIIRNYKKGPEIIRRALLASEDSTRPPGDYPGYEGPLFIEYGTFEGGGVDMVGAPANWPMSIAELTTLLTSTGELDVICEPIDTAGNMARIHAYNGDYGTNRSGTVVFEYATGAHNVREMRQVEDATNIVNRLWYLLGPRKDDQHWHNSINGADPSNWTQLPWYAAFIGVLADRDVSYNWFGGRMEIQVHDSRNDEGLIGLNLYRRLWVIESWIRAFPRHLISFTPIRGYNPNAFGIGDLVGVVAGPYMRAPYPRPGFDWPERGFSGAQRIFEYTVSWDTEGVTTISDIVTSPTDNNFG